MTEPIPLRFQMSAPDVGALPASPAEVAVIGRSNVGKSSLVNALAGRERLARTSKAPGRTAMLNCFATPAGATLVDLPGYGYAKVSATERAAWRARMDHYLATREPLVMVLALIDGEVGPTALDREVLAQLRAAEVPLQIVATKHDKVRSSKRQRRRRDLAAGCEVPLDQVLWVSAQRGTGLDRLRAAVDAWLRGPTRS